ncbi:hypothetical protein ABUE31_04795 [Mesorhizobium sp. ZMM04-5]|uniref:Uncharacterized protein n=1 Tax=Mesorhizobium marinum TaxID=3228790 RepID=A0ABV3QW76_9HYPH
MQFSKPMNGHILVPVSREEKAALHALARARSVAQGQLIRDGGIVRLEMVAA